MRACPLFALLTTSAHCDLRLRRVILLFTGRHSDGNTRTGYQLQSNYTANIPNSIHQTQHDWIGQGEKRALYLPTEKNENKVFPLFSLTYLMPK